MIVESVKVDQLGASYGGTTKDVIEIGVIKVRYSFTLSELNNMGNFMSSNLHF